MNPNMFGKNNHTHNYCTSIHEYVSMAMHIIKRRKTKQTLKPLLVTKQLKQHLVVDLCELVGTEEEVDKPGIDKVGLKIMKLYMNYKLR